MNWTFEYTPMSAIPGVQGGQFMMRKNQDKSLVFAIFPVVAVENKDKALNMVKIAQAAPEMLERLVEVEKELLAIDWSELGLHLDDGFLPREGSDKFVNIQLQIAKIGAAISEIRKLNDI